VGEDIALTSSRDILTAIAHGEGPQHYLIALGYAGWGAGQLEQELAANAWLSCPADPHILFDLPIEKRWSAAAALLGIDLNLLSSECGHA
jgi:putative transcriptional regulator